jgi:copper(I)-binding protein
LTAVLQFQAGKTIQLAPGGFHVMLIGLKAPLNADENYQVTLRVEKAGKVNLTGLAKRPADLRMPDAHSPDAHSMDMPKSN